MTPAVWRAGLLLGALGALTGCPTDGSTDSSSSSSSSGVVGSSSSDGTSSGVSASGSGSSSSGQVGSSSGSVTSGSGAGTSTSGMVVTSSGGGSSSGSATSGTQASSGMQGSSSSGPRDGTVTDCGRTLMPPNDGGTCTVTAGNGFKLLEGNVLVGDASLHGGQVLVGSNGSILCAACNCDGMQEAQGATRITCANGVISPGLINAHDHLTYNQEAPYVPAAVRAHERYEHRNDWRSGNGGHYDIPYDQGGDNGSRQGEMRQVLGGTTVINGSGGVAGLARNPDRGALSGGLTGGSVLYDTFPLGTSQRLTNGCNYSDKPNPTATNIMNAVAYTPHISEGIDLSAYNEFQCLSRSENGAVDVVLAKTGVIHGIGLRAPDYALMATDDASLIWSPRSNISLYGHTAQTPMAHRLGVRIALGTDWTLSGSINLLRELACVRDLNNRAFGGYFTDLDMWKMATSNGARALGIHNQVGSLTAGKLADIAIFRTAAGRQDWRAVVTAHVRDVVLVMRAGLPLTGDAAVMEGLAQQSCEQVDLCGVQKRICAQRETSMSFSQMVTAANEYALYFCSDVPEDEPTCVPSRPPPPQGSSSPFNNFPFVPGDPADDTDGDGVPNAQDNCPSVFNPARPMDANMQPDFDGDMAGDACDVCPLNPNTETCSAPDPNDADGDGTPNDTDNCPNISNMDQLDTDMDDKGDACDACPTVSNPGNAACPATIYDIKNGTIAVGATVALSNVLVTAVGPTGYFVAVKPGDTGYTTEDFSGLFVFTSAMGTKPNVGDRINIASGTTVRFSGQIQLQNAPFTVSSSMEALPDFIVVDDPSLSATGGMRAAALEGLLVRINNVTVTDTMPTPGTMDSPTPNEFMVTGDLRVNDYFHLLQPFPTQGDPLTYVQGVLRIFNDVMKLEPRDEADVGVSLRLVGFSAPQGFVDEGQMDVPVLMVRVNRPPEMDTPVTITSSDETSLTVMGATVLAGQLEAPVLVTGIMQSPSVTLTATLDMSMATATVRVVGATEVPALVALNTTATEVTLGGSVPMSVHLDIPARAGGTVVTLSTMGGGTVPATVMVPAGELTQGFDFLAPDMPGMVTVTAQVDAAMFSQVVSVLEPVMGSGPVVISQIYGGGGNSGATFRNDFVELFNRSNAPVDLSGWRLQYASTDGAFGPTSNGVALTGTIPANGYFLVQGASGGAVGAALPTADVSFNTNFSAANGKVVLLNADTFSGTGCPWPMELPSNLVDYVGFGTANCAFGGGGAAPAGSNTSAIIRAGSGCTNTGNNAADFAAGTPTPRNSASPATTCN